MVENTVTLILQCICFEISVFTRQTNIKRQHLKRLTLERTVEDIRHRYGLGMINFAALTTGLKMPAHREVEYKMPSVMYH